MEKPVKFPNKNGLMLRGILHSPQTGSESGKRGIIFLTSGFGTRTYVHNLYAGMARELSRAGYYVLRFDFHGLGESEGEFVPGLFIDWYNEVESGLFVNDVESSIDFLEAECGIKDIVLIGICGGAITGLLGTAAIDRAIRGSILIGLPITMDSPNRPYEQETTAGGAKLSIAGYLPRLFRPKSWLRFFTFKSDYKTIIRSFAAIIKSCMVFRSPGGQADWESRVDHPEFNPKVIPSFLSCFQKKRKLLIVYSEFDRLRYEFESEFQNKCLRFDDRYNEFYEVEIVKEANHEFHFQKSKDRLSEIVSNWLQRYFPQSEIGAAAEITGKKS